MYLSYFNLKRQPFQINTDPRFLWLGEKHKEALATLKYGIQDNKGFLLLTGDVGTGKTTLINALLNSLDEKVVVATISDPGLSQLEFFQFVAHSFGIRAPVSSKVEFLLQFGLFLQEQADREQKVLLLIDEAQRLTHELLEEIRLLSNIERQKTKLLNIFFIGQNEFNELLADPRNRALRQRITVNYHIRALSEEEVANYIRHRLIIAGSRKTLFAPDAVRQVYLFSGGYPRLINIICDRALLTCYVEDGKLVKAGTVKECARELELPRPSRSSPFPGQAREGTEDSSQPPRTGPGFQRRRRWLYAGVATPLIAMAGLVVYPTDIRMLREIREVITGFGEEVRDRAVELTGRGSKEGPAAIGTEKQPSRDKSGPGSAEPENPVQTEKPIRPSRAGEPVRQLRAAEQEDISYGVIMEEPLAEEPAGSPARGVDMVAELPQPGAGRPELLDFVINFELNSSRATANSLQELERLAAIMHAHPDFRAVAVGYTDTSGFYQHNLMISKSRVDMVKGYLVGQGIGPNRIQTVAKGPEHPIASNETEAGRRLNRRVEIQLIRGG